MFRRHHHKNATAAAAWIRLLSTQQSPAPVSPPPGRWNFAGYHARVKASPSRGLGSGKLGEGFYVSTDENAALLGAKEAPSDVEICNVFYNADWDWHEPVMVPHTKQNEKFKTEKFASDKVLVDAHDMSGPSYLPSEYKFSHNIVNMENSPVLLEVSYSLAAQEATLSSEKEKPHVVPAYPPQRVSVAAATGDCFFSAVGFQVCLTEQERHEHLKHVTVGECLPFAHPSVASQFEISAEVRGTLASWMAHCAFEKPLSKLSPHDQPVGSPQGKRYSELFDLVTLFGEDTAFLRPTLAHTIVDMAKPSRTSSTSVWGDANLLWPAVIGVYQRPLLVHCENGIPPQLMIDHERVFTEAADGPLRLPLEIHHGGNHFDACSWRGPFRGVTL